jgi:hypothetical protein
MNTVHALSHIQCIVSRWARSCPDYVTLWTKLATFGDTSNGTHIHLAIGRTLNEH